MTDGTPTSIVTDSRDNIWFGDLHTNFVGVDGVPQTLAAVYIETTEIGDAAWGSGGYSDGYVVATPQGGGSLTSTDDLSGNPGRDAADEHDDFILYERPGRRSDGRGSGHDL